jgi:glycosyltransferase involved in cell wall biosynthesis
MLPPAKRVLYYAIDVIRKNKNDPWWPESRLVQSVDCVLTTSIRHKERLASAFHRTDIEVVPHGVDFTSALNHTNHEFERSEPGSVIGYTGSIHDTYVDFDVVRDVATKRPDWRFVFVGPTQRNALSVGATEKINLIKELSNVEFVGPKPYSELSALIRNFDCCIMPYALSVDNEPFKILNYFAQGKPVVSSDVSGIVEYKHLLYTYRTSAEMIDAIEEALNEAAGSKMQQARIKFAEARDFSLITTRLLSLFGVSSRSFS